MNPALAPVVAVISLPQLLTTLALPPVGLLLVTLLGGLLAWRGWRPGGLAALLAAVVLLLLSTPLVAGLLRLSLEREISQALAQPAPAGAAPPGAIVILGGEVIHGADGAMPGPLTLERLRIGAALHRRTGLPLLVTGGVLSPGDPAIAVLMARSLTADFGVPVRWIEDRAPDTRGNAAFSTAMLRAEDIGSAYVVSHAWHLPRALAAFDRDGLRALPVPVALQGPPHPRLTDLVPRADKLMESWFALREWAGRVVYAIRD